MPVPGRVPRGGGMGTLAFGFPAEPEFALWLGPALEFAPAGDPKFALPLFASTVPLGESEVVGGGVPKFFFGTAGGSAPKTASECIV